MSKKSTKPKFQEPEAPVLTKQEIQVELQKLVDDQKRKIAEGKALPDEALALRHEERKMAALGRHNIVSMGDAMKEVMPKLEEMRDRFLSHFAEIREKVHSVERERCIEHEQELEINVEHTAGQSWINGTFTIVYQPCEKCEAEKKEASERAKWLERGVPEKVLHATFDNYDATKGEGREKALLKFRKQTEKGNGFIIAVGLWGTGKSHLAVATMKAKGGGIFITEHDLVGELRQTYSENTGQDAMVERYRTAKVLVLDELTKDVKGVDIAPLLYRVLGYRHDKGLLTVITSNETLTDCMSILGPKLRDRFRENYVVVNFTWESNRQPQEQEV